MICIIKCDAFADHDITSGFKCEVLQACNHPALIPACLQLPKLYWFYIARASFVLPLHQIKLRCSELKNLIFFWVTIRLWLYRFSSSVILVVLFQVPSVMFNIHLDILRLVFLLFSLLFATYRFNWMPASQFYNGLILHSEYRLLG